MVISHSAQRMNKPTFLDGVHAGSRIRCLKPADAGQEVHHGRAANVDVFVVARQGGVQARDPVGVAGLVQRERDAVVGDLRLGVHDGVGAHEHDVSSDGGAPDVGVCSRRGDGCCVLDLYMGHTYKGWY